jgi:hypothetical protein
VHRGDAGQCNSTGASYPLSELGAKQLGLLRELVPAAGRVGLLVNTFGPPHPAAPRCGQAPRAQK